MNSKLTNPFETNENLQPTFEASERYQTAKNQAFASFQTRSGIQNHEQNTTKPNFNLPQFMSFNFTHLTKLSFAALTIFTLLAGGVAAQALAPNNYKPTQVAQSIKDKYFGANKQKDADPVLALLKDEGNYVELLSGCGLIIKFPKSILKDDVNVLLSQNNNSNSYSIGIQKLTPILGQESPKENFRYFIDCEPLNSINFFDVGNRDIYFDKDKIISESISSENFIKETGWFIGGNNLINLNKFYLEINETINYSFYGYSFDKNQNRYRIYTDKIGIKKPLSFSDFQLQFQDQVK
jgi:hypothetical protein